MALINIEDVQRAMGRPLSEIEQGRVGHLIDASEAAFMAEAGICFGQGHDRVRLIPCFGQVRISQPGVTAVDVVADEDGHEVLWGWDKDAPQIVAVKTRSPVWVA